MNLPSSSLPLIHPFIHPQNAPSFFLEEGRCFSLAFLAHKIPQYIEGREGRRPRHCQLRGISSFLDCPFLGKGKGCWQWRIEDAWSSAHGWAPVLALPLPWLGHNEHALWPASRPLKMNGRKRGSLTHTHTHHSHGPDFACFSAGEMKDNFSWHFKEGRRRRNKKIKKAKYGNLNEEAAATVWFGFGFPCHGDSTSSKKHLTTTFRGWWMMNAFWWKEPHFVVRTQNLWSLEMIC